jgi:hypothetical protein
LGVFGFWFLQITNLFSTIVLEKESWVHSTDLYKILIIIVFD